MMSERLDIRYAGFWVRVLACVIDLVLYTPFYFACMILLPSPPWLADAVFMAIALLTYAWFFSSAWQGSPGMRIMKIHVRSTHGRRLKFPHALAWGVTGTVGWFVCAAGLLYLNMRFDLQGIRRTIEQNAALGIYKPEIEQAFGITLGQFLLLSYLAIGIFLVFCVLWALSIALPKEKTGFHNVLCKTRFVHGRPDNA